LIKKFIKEIIAKTGSIHQDTNVVSILYISK